jgi:hypothetical protein
MRASFAFPGVFSNDRTAARPGESHLSLSEAALTWTSYRMYNSFRS